MSKKIMILILALLTTITVACVAAVTVILTKQEVNRSLFLFRSLLDGCKRED